VSVGIRCAVLGGTTGNPVSANTASRFTGTQPQSGDRAILIYFNNYFNLSNMGTPSGGPTWNTFTNNTADAGADNAHIKAYHGNVTSNADFTASATETGSADEEKGILIIVLSGVDASTTIDIAAVATATSDNDQICPSVDPVSTDGFAIWFVSSGTGAASASYTHPGGTTELTEIHIGSGLSGSCAYEQLASSNATGTRTFSATSATPYAAISIVVKTASGSQNLSRTATDNAAATDTVARTSSRPRTISDNAAATDSVARTSSRSRGIADSAGATDGVTRATSRTRNIADSASASDSVSRISVRTRLVSDNAAATDGVVHAQGKLRTASDTASATDVVTTSQAKLRTASDNAVATDTNAPVVSLTRTSADTAPATDVVSHEQGSGNLSRSVSDSAAASDAVTRSIVTTRMSADAASASDSVVRSISSTRGVGDSASAADVVSVVRGIVRTVADSAGASDSVARLVRFVRGIGDNAAATDVALVGATGAWPPSVGSPSSVEYVVASTGATVKLLAVGVPRDVEFVAVG
jgi:hypothetical protein